MKKQQTPFPVHPLALAAMLALAASGQASAQTQAAAPAPSASAATSSSAAVTSRSDDTAETIVITAQKRLEKPKDVPINVSAFSGASLAQEGVVTINDLTRLVPTLKINSPIGTLATRFAIRGIGSFGNSAIEPSVATFINGIYVPRPASTLSSLLDVEAIEVLSGPQGTLFGRNASVGAISYRTGTPTGDFSGSARTELATGDRWRTEAVVNVPISDIFALRIAGLNDEFGGYWRQAPGGQRFGGIDTKAGRATLVADFLPNLTWTVKADYQKNTGDGAANQRLIPESLTPATLARFQSEMLGTPIDASDQFGKRNTVAIANYRLDDTYRSASSDLSYETGGFTLRLLNGTNNWDSPQTDGDTAQLPLYVVGRNLHYESRSNSHELQIVSPRGMLGGKFDFVAGLYYFHEDFGIRIDNVSGDNFCDVLIPLPALAAAFGGVPGATTAAKINSCRGYGIGAVNSFGDFDQTTKSAAGYTQGTYRIVPELDVTGGVRYTNERKSGSYFGSVLNPTGRLFQTDENTALATRGARWTWRANVAFRPTSTAMLFATASTGFKSGGFNNAATTGVLGQARVFQPETTKNYELGAKTQWWNNALTLNATVFQMDIDQFQERGTIQGLTATTRNVGAVRQRGVEFESTVKPIDHLRLSAALTYLDSDIKSYCGAPLPAYRTQPAPASCPGTAANTQDLKGASLTFNPKWAGNVGATVDGTFGANAWRWLVNGDVNFTAKQNAAVNNDNGPLTVQPGYALFNLRATFFAPNDQWFVGLYGRNLADKGYCVTKGYQTFSGPLGLNVDRNGDGVNDDTARRCVVGSPRVVGVTAGVKF